MKPFRRWHLLLIPVPVVGWLLLLAYLLDERLGAPELSKHAETSATPPSSLPGSRRVGAAILDTICVVVTWALLPPAAGWLVSAVYLVCRDAHGGRYSLGKRAFGIRIWALDESSFTRSFERNFLLLVPYVGPLVEGMFVLSGSLRLGDRIAGTRLYCLSGDILGVVPPDR